MVFAKLKNSAMTTNKWRSNAKKKKKKKINTKITNILILKKLYYILYSHFISRFLNVSALTTDLTDLFATGSQLPPFHEERRERERDKSSREMTNFISS